MPNRDARRKKKSGGSSPSSNGIAQSLSWSIHRSSDTATTMADVLPRSQSFDPQKSRGSSSLAAHHHSNMPPSSEPIYHDVGGASSRQRKQPRISPAHTRRKHGCVTYSSPYDASDLKLARETLHQFENKQKKSKKRQNDSSTNAAITNAETLMFSDAWVTAAHSVGENSSVMSGWSEQQLLAKRKKKEEMKRNSSRKYGKKKKRQDRILNMPSGLLRRIGSNENLNESGAGAVGGTPPLGRSGGRYVRESKDPLHPSRGGGTGEGTRRRSGSPRGAEGNRRRARSPFKNSQTRKVPLAQPNEQQPRRLMGSFRTLLTRASSMDDLSRGANSTHTSTSTAPDLEQQQPPAEQAPEQTKSQKKESMRRRLTRSLSPAKAKQSPAHSKPRKQRDPPSSHQQPQMEPDGELPETDTSIYVRSTSNERYTARQMYKQNLAAAAASAYQPPRRAKESKPSLVEEKWRRGIAAAQQMYGLEPSYPYYTQEEYEQHDTTAPDDAIAVAHDDRSPTSVMDGGGSPSSSNGSKYLKSKKQRALSFESPVEKEKQGSSIALDDSGRSGGSRTTVRSSSSWDRQTGEPRPKSILRRPFRGKSPQSSMEDSLQSSTRSQQSNRSSSSSKDDWQTEPTTMDYYSSSSAGGGANAGLYAIREDDQPSPPRSKEEQMGGFPRLVPPVSEPRRSKSSSTRFDNRENDLYVSSPSTASSGRIQEGVWSSSLLFGGMDDGRAPDFDLDPPPPSNNSSFQFDPALMPEDVDRMEALKKKEKEQAEETSSKASSQRRTEQPEQHKGSVENDGNHNASARAINAGGKTTSRLDVEPPKSPEDGGFFDKEGFEVSPIRKTRRRGTEDDTSATAFQSKAEPTRQSQKSQENEDEKTGTREAGKPWLVAEDNHLNEEEFFVYVVCAVVIQAAVRRFLARLRVGRQLGVYSPPQPVRFVEVNSGHHQQSVSLDTSTCPQVAALNSTTIGETMASQKLQLGGGVTEEEPVFENMAVRLFQVAAIKIQAVFRGWWVRDSLFVDDYCARSIQRMVRGHLSRVTHRKEQQSAIAIQSAARSFLAQEQAAEKLAHIMTIQAIGRAFLARLQVRQMLYDRNMSSASSFYDDSRYFSTTFEESATYDDIVSPDEAATIIQTYWRCFYMEIWYLHTIADVCFLQSIIRGWLVRHKLAEEAAAAVPEQQEMESVSTPPSSLTSSPRRIPLLQRGQARLKAKRAAGCQSRGVPATADATESDSSSSCSPSSEETSSMMLDQPSCRWPQPGEGEDKWKKQTKTQRAHSIGSATTTTATAILTDITEFEKEQSTMLNTSTDDQASMASSGSKRHNIFLKLDGRKLKRTGRHDQPQSIAERRASAFVRESPPKPLPRFAPRNAMQRSQQVVRREMSSSPPAMVPKPKHAVVASPSSDDCRRRIRHFRPEHDAIEDDSDGKLLPKRGGYRREPQKPANVSPFYDEHDSGRGISPTFVANHQTYPVGPQRGSLRKNPFFELERKNTVDSFSGQSMARTSTFSSVPGTGGGARSHAATKQNECKDEEVTGNRRSHFQQRRVSTQSGQSNERAEQVEPATTAPAPPRKKVFEGGVASFWKQREQENSAAPDFSNYKTKTIRKGTQD